VYAGDVGQVEAFQGSGFPRVFLTTQKRGARALTLTAATLVIYYGNSENNEERSQSEARPHRIGQRNPVTYVDLIAVGTIDEKIRARLKDKRKRAKRITPSNWQDFL